VSEDPGVLAMTTRIEVPDLLVFCGACAIFVRNLLGTDLMISNVQHNNAFAPVVGKVVARLPGFLLSLLRLLP